MNDLRVCNVDEEGRFGGPERRIVQVAKALHCFGVHTHIVFSSLDSSKFETYINSNGVDATRMNITRLSKEPKILFRYVFLFIFDLIRLIFFFQRHQFDFVHVNGSYQFKIAIAAKLAGIKTIWHLNDTKMDWLVKKLFSYVANHCALGFIVAGNRVYDYYLKGTVLARLPCVEIHAPVDTSVFSPDLCATQLQVVQPDAAGTINIVTVSGLNPTKGLEFFIQMAISLYALDSRVRFKVAGAELKSQIEYITKIKLMVQESGLPDGIISFLGMVDDVPKLLCTAHICVFSSISEASPTSVWEALSMGKAVVTTDVGSVSQYINDGHSGFIVPVGDVAGLLEKTILLINDEKLRAAVGQNARVLAVDQLDIKIAARKHSEIYRQLSC